MIILGNALTSFLVSVFVVFLFAPAFRRWKVKKHNEALEQQEERVDRAWHKSVFVTRNSAARRLARTIFDDTKDPSTDIVRLVYLNVAWEDPIEKDESVDLIRRCHAFAKELFGDAVPAETCFEILEFVPFGATREEERAIFDVLRHGVDCARGAYVAASIETCLEVANQFFNDGITLTEKQS